MNRRSFISLLAGAAGAPLVHWRGLVDPTIFLPTRHVCGGPWCNHPARAVSVTAEQIAEDIERCLQQLLRHSGPVPYSYDGLRLIQVHVGEALERFVPLPMSIELDGQTFTLSS